MRNRTLTQSTLRIVGSFTRNRERIGKPVAVCHSLADQLNLFKLGRSSLLEVSVVNRMGGGTGEGMMSVYGLSATTGTRWTRLS